ncbi:MAG: FecR domain-containing protein, partial [Deltaproteobacteria bacterium]|nr:FecR domain-containing protein [Deltaproteobacteria bacterium]
MRTFRMNIFRRCLWYSCLVLFTAVLVASPVCRASAADGSLVGRIFYVEGQLLRFVPTEKDWVAAVRDAPFGMDDTLYSDQGGKAELIMPNRTWVRIGSSTQIQIIALKTDVTEVDVASGIARFYNKSSNALIKATTSFGYVVAPPGSVFDLYVGDQSAEVITLSGKVDFIHASDSARYEVVRGVPSLIADAGQVGTGEAKVDADWDDWNVTRDSLWSKRVSMKGESAKYLPAELHDETYELDENGVWETVIYEGKARRFWRPTRVGSGWAPFTAGRWTEYHGDNTWVPDEPFGYATHHYGNWVFVNNAWYWGPPETVGVGVGWYPGRVAWIGSGEDVGWVPLAPTERYYSHYAWGAGATVIGTAAVVGLTIGSLAYINHAVVVPQHDFYGVNNYSRVRVANINKTV